VGTYGSGCNNSNLPMGNIHVEQVDTSDGRAGHDYWVGRIGMLGAATLILADLTMNDSQRSTCRIDSQSLHQLSANIIIRHTQKRSLLLKISSVLILRVIIPILTVFVMPLSSPLTPSPNSSFPSPLSTKPDRALYFCVLCTLLGKTRL
jgi:hypothetical protein